MLAYQETVVRETVWKLGECGAKKCEERLF